MTKYIKLENRVFFFIMFALVIFLAYGIVAPLISLILLVILLALLFQPVYEGFHKLFRRSASLASAATLVVIMLCVIIPVLIIGYITANQVKVFVNDLGDFAGIETVFEDQSQSSGDPELDSRTAIITGQQDTNAKTTIGNLDVQAFIDDLNNFIDQVPLINTQITLDDVRNVIGDVVVSVAKPIGSEIIGFAAGFPILAIHLIVFIILLGTLLPSLRKLKSYIIRLSPLDNEIDNLYIKKVQAMATSMVRGTFIVSLIQGLICGILFLLAGVDYAIFWTLLCIFLSFIPSGAAIVNWPIFLVLLISGNIPGAAIIFFGNLFLVGSVDNIIRPFLVSEDARMHPALIVVGIVGGLQAIGALGLIYGPVVMIFLITTFEIYIEHYKE